MSTASVFRTERQEISPAVTEPYPNAEAVLTGRLAEFRTALRQEMEAIGRCAASSGVGLVHGRRIGLVGGSVYYIFEIENALDLPGDAPGDLLLPNREPLEVSVVAVDGMAITLSVPQDLGSFVPCARLHSNLTFLMRKLIERIETKVNLPNVVGDRLLGADVHGSPASVDEKPYGLNPEQSRALAASLGFDVTFVQGPPGAGKSKTIGAIATALLRSDRSVLIVSHTNGAVDRALLEMNEYLVDEERRQGLVIRVGDPRDVQLQERQPDLLLSPQVERRFQSLVDRRTSLQHVREQWIEKVKDLGKRIELREWVRLAATDIEQMQGELDGLRSCETEIERLRDVLHDLESQAEHFERLRADAEQIERDTSRLGQVVELMDAARSEIAQVTEATERLDAELRQAKALLAETCTVNWLVRKWGRLSAPKEQAGKVQSLLDAVEERGLTLDKVKAKLHALEEERGVLTETVQRSQQSCRCEPAELLRRVHAYDTHVRETAAKIQDLNRNSQSRTEKLQDLLRTRMSALVQLGLAEDGPDSVEGMLARLESAYKRVVDMTKDKGPDAVVSDRDACHAQIRTIETELLAVEKDLKRVEQLVIEAARVVAATWTGVCLRGSIQSRTFDTIIIDEASMAPIPALWAAASAATSSAVVVGDSKQLPPSVISTQELARKWLGTDIFEAVGICSGHPLFIQLKEQYRMHPDISAAVNALIYEGELTDADKAREIRDPEWYNPAWRYDCHVLLVDIGDLNAWMTSVRQDHEISRLNFLSAAVCLDIAEQLLREGREPADAENRPRILIVSPYGAHARLLELMIEEQKLSAEVRAGTVHGFQASDADAVILDLVDDEPGWKTAMLMADYDHDVRRLLNVAITRAKCRLLVVGDFAYVQKCGKKAFVGRELIPFLKERCKRVSALDVVKSGLAAKATRTQKAAYRGEIAPHEARIVVTEGEFDGYLREDIARAQQRIIVYSPLIRQNRLSLFKPQLKAAVERGARVYVVTKPFSDRGKKEVAHYRLLEKTLEEWGVVVIHKQRMHERLIFIDDTVLWEGSLNPLSYGDTEEYMERRISKRVVEEYEKTLRLHELLQEYASGSPVCPICQSEVVACEGTDEPYFWRCVCDGCYTRGIDQPLQDGMITCARCGYPVEYGEWGGKPAWRCTKNRHHHQRLAQSHLRLPRMCALIPRGELRKVHRYFGLRPERESGGNEQTSSQVLLFRQDHHQ